MIERLLDQQDREDIKDSSDQFNIFHTTQLTKKEKLAHYETPDYCIITKAKTLNLLKLELDPLCSEGGIFYQVYNKVESEEDINKRDILADEPVKVVIFIDDNKLDTMAELLKVETRLKNYDCTLPFKSFAREMFWQFNSRQHHFIVMETLRRELDFGFLMNAGIVLDHFPLHAPERNRIYQSWNEYKNRLAIGMIFKDLELNM